MSLVTIFLLGALFRFFPPVRMAVDEDARGLVPACGDEDFSRIVRNLVANALQALPDGGRVEVRTRLDGGEIA